MQRVLVVAVLALLVSQVAADVYLHRARGSNNRLDDENRDRDNANRMFDSQNNNRGGYNVGGMYYYAGSTLNMEWTNQHSCGGPNAGCEIVIQYMCDARLRDGTTSNTIPITPINCIGWDCDTDVRFGRHESLASYKNCQYRERNKGLFNANQQLNGNSAIYTRQNPNGERRGYECPEERDYYPNWAPSEWRDLALLTNQPQRCAAYQAESQNVMERWSCVPPIGWVNQRVTNGATGFIPITQEKCELITYVDPVDNITRTGQWVRTAPFGIAPPVCHENIWTRDNHLGNVGGGFPAGFNLTIPADLIHDQCAIRLRYNISTGDLGEQQDVANWATATSIQSSAFLNASLNENRQPTERFAAKVNIWSKYGLSYASVADSFDPNKNNDNEGDGTLKNSRDYVFKDNPRVNIFGGLVTNGQVVKLRLAINTNQFGRTFQDRTHRFAIKARPDYLQSATIHNINVDGKRGNIVQTYPGTEYNFGPRRLHARRGDMIHFQWTGSNTNPNNNAGQGRQGSDRHNAVILRAPVYFENGQGPTNPPTLGHFGRSYPARVDGPWTFLGFDVSDLKSLARAQVVGATWSGELSELDDASTYFDLGPRTITQNGIYHYICTRNNNFSNRDQRETVIVSDSTAITQALGWNGGRIYGANGVYLEAEQGDLTALNIITIETHGDGASNTMHDVASDFVDVQPMTFNIARQRSLTLAVPYSRNGVGRTVMYRSPTQHGTWSEIGAEYEGGVAYAQISEGGWYVVQTQTNWAGVIGVTLAVCVVIAGGAYGLYRYKKKKAAASGGAGVSTSYAGRRV